MTPSYSLSSSIAPVITDYLSLKRALGRRFSSESWVLFGLDRFLATRPSGGNALTSENFASWCLTLTHLSVTTRRNRMRIVRNLCLYRRRRDPGCFIPDLATFPTPHTPPRPHILSEEEIVRLLRAADDLSVRSTSPLRGPMERVAVVLLYTAGLRRGELARLALSDYDPSERTLLIRASKFHKSRLVALSPDAVREIEKYLLVRHRLPCDPHAPLLICSWRGLRARSGAGLGNSLRRLFDHAGLRTAAGRLPRVHDLRHTHAVHVLLHWYRVGLDVQAKLPALATSMGHVSVVSTAYYLSLLDPVARAASERFERHCAHLLAELHMGGGDR
jgi:integrase/recombinase XerD